MAWSYHVLEQPGCGKMCLVGKGSIDVYLFPRCKERVDFEGFGGYGLWLIAPECVNYIRILWIWICVHRMMVTMVLLAVCVEYDLFRNLAWASHGSYHCLKSSNVEFHTNRMSVVRGVSSLAIWAPPTWKFTVWWCPDSKCEAEIEQKPCL